MAEQSSRKKQHRLYKGKHCFCDDPGQSKWQQDQPYQGHEQGRDERQRPEQQEEQAPAKEKEKKFHGRFRCGLEQRSNRLRGLAKLTAVPCRKKLLLML